MWNCARFGKFSEQSSMTPFFFALYAIWIPLSIARPWIFPYWWSMWAPSGEILYGQNTSPSGDLCYNDS